LSIRPEQRQAIVSRVASIKTREDARQYMAEVQERLRPYRPQVK
jgi:hypothetical protein